MIFLVALVIAVVVVVLVMRAASNPGGPRPTVRPVRRPRPQRGGRPLAPDDDPDFLRELERRTRRDEGSPG